MACFHRIAQLLSSFYSSFLVGLKGIPANALTPVHEYKGPCTLVLTKKSIEVRTDKDEDLGKWNFEFIRRFHSQDTQYFSFTSGRRGPYGVQDYSFRLQENDLKQLQLLLSQRTGQINKFWLFSLHGVCTSILTHEYIRIRFWLHPFATPPIIHVHEPLTLTKPYS